MGILLNGIKQADSINNLIKINKITIKIPQNCTICIKSLITHLIPTPTKQKYVHIDKMIILFLANNDYFCNLEKENKTQQT